MSDFTPGPWVLTEPDQWPYPLYIKNEAGRRIVDMSRYATSTQQNSLADCMEGVGFRASERPEAIEVNARQRADARLIASAPALLEALKAAQEMIDVALPQFDWGKSSLSADAIRLLNEAPSAVRAALSLAEGEG